MPRGQFQEARALYAAGDAPVAEIADMLGLGVTAFYDLVRIWGRPPTAPFRPPPSRFPRSWTTTPRRAD